MSGITYDYMEKYIRGLVPESSGILKDMEEFAIKNSVPIVQKETANFLKTMITLMKPKKILELGTAIGYSSILMELSSQNNCEIVTIERNKEMIELAQSNINKYGFQDKIKILEGECLETLKKLDDEFDLIFMDAGKGHYNHFLPECLRMLKKEGTIIADNVLFRGMVASKDLVVRRKITIVKRMKKYLDLVCKDENLITSVIPMGDGIAVTTRRNNNE